MRVLIGLIKGGIIGGGLGLGFVYLGGVAEGAVFHYLLYGVIGLLVGLVAGRPLWEKRESRLIPLFRALVGIGVCVGLFALATKAFGDPALPFVTSSWPRIGAAGADGATLSETPYLLGAAIGIVYGVFVEVDDGKKEEPKKA